MKTREQETELLSEIKEPEIEELAQPSEIQGGDIPEEAFQTHIDVFLNRLFTVGEILPWKKCKFVVVGVRGGIVGLALRSILQPPKARDNHGVRHSRSKKSKRSGAGR